jgi:hypothetical protein
MRTTESVNSKNARNLSRLFIESGYIPDAGVAFGELWSCGKDLDRDGLERYEEYFAERNRVRSPTDLQVLGIADQLGESIEEIDVVPRSARHRAPPTISTRVASTAWAGLESSTGEYRFQVEFPRSAGEVLARLVGSFGRRAEVSVLCEDGVIRPMTYRFYEDNSMFRLNVPNDVAGVQEARTRRSGVALVEKVASQDAPVRLVIFHDRSEIDKIVKRSLALGTLGQTSTRLYGWY